jgi:hypothetical protein
MVAGQKIVLGRIHARQIVTVHFAAETITEARRQARGRVPRREAIGHETGKQAA